MNIAIVFATLFQTALFAQTVMVSTLAGSGAFGSVDGTGTAASFNEPRGVAIDGSGNVYVADHSSHKIRKITPAGVVSTFAGSGAVGSADGIGTAASFNYPSGVALDASGNIYVADRNNHKIRKITPAGLVSSLAGSGFVGNSDGTGISASFSSPWGVAIDGLGNVYVADAFNYKIRKITPAGTVSTLAGSGARGSTDGAGATASFDYPIGVAVDASGNVYVADHINFKIRKITPAGVVSTFAGSGTYGSVDGTGTTASFVYPLGLALDGFGNLYVGDLLNQKIRKITPVGVVSTLAGIGTDGSVDGAGTVASFKEPSGVAVDGSGNVYVGDYGNNKIRKITVSNSGVYIPDPNFRAYLQSHYPSCMNGSYLDPNCGQVTNQTWLDVSNLNIADLTGITYFTSLNLLVCNSNQLTFLPPLPASLQTLYCNSNQLTALPNLPAGLQTLWCNNNLLTSLPTLPLGLQELRCYSNQLTSLPTLPAGLQKLNCNTNPLGTLGALPASLQELDCTSNQLSSLPSLPSSLINLYCGYNSLTALPALPSSMQILICNANQLNSLPALPSSLQTLYCPSNQLTALPALPSSLQSINCAVNLLTALPLLPNSLCTLVAFGNSIACLPNIPTCSTFSSDIGLLVCIPITCSVSANVLCSGTDIAVAYTSTLNANAGNVFTAQLSNANGSFTNPINIGFVNALNSGSINASIPYVTSAGAGYRIRVVASNPAAIGAANGQDISIVKGTDPLLSMNGVTALCSNASGQIYSVASPVAGSSYTWTVPNGASIVSGQNTSSILVNFASTAGNISVLENNGQTCPTYLIAKAITLYNSADVATSAITGSTALCGAQNNVVYTVSNHSGSTYTWNVPTGFTMVSGQGTNSISVNISNTALAGIISLTETNVCASTTTVTLPVSIKSYALSNAVLYCGTSNVVDIALTSTNPISSGIIGLDFKLNYDATKLTPTGTATIGTVATSFATYALNTTTPGIVYVSVYLNNAPIGTFFKGAGDIVSIAFTRKTAFAINSTTALTTSTIEESTPLSSLAACNALAGSIAYQGSYNALVVYRNTTDVMKGSVTKVQGTSANCTVNTSVTSVADANGIIRINSNANTTGMKVSRDILGDKNIAKLNCSNVQNVINSVDRNVALSISNFSLTNPTVYQLMAADVNLDGKVTAGDAALISSRSVNAYNCEFPQASTYAWNGTDFVPNAVYVPSTDWLFIDKTTISSAAFTAGMGRNNVPKVPKCIAIANVNPTVCNTTNNETIQGILLGDVNGNWTNTTDGANIRTSAMDEVIIDLQNTIATSNTSYSIPVHYSSINTLEGLDFSIDYDGTQLSIDTLEALGLKDWALVYNNIEEEKVMVNAYSYQGIQSSDAVLWMQVITDGHVPTVQDFGTIEAYINGNPAHVRIKDGSNTTGVLNVNELTLLSAYPNPFNQSIQVKLADTYSGTFNLSVYDVSGRVCETQFGLSAGEVIEMGALLGAGMYLIEVQGESKTERIQVVKQ